MGKVIVDKNYQPVGKGGAEPAFVFNEDDPRLEKYQAAAKAKGAPAPAAKAAAEDDGSVERVERPKAASK